MTTYDKRAGVRNLPLDLFNGAAARETLRSSDPAALRIAARYRISVSHAALILRLAGLGVEDLR